MHSAILIAAFAALAAASPAPQNLDFIGIAATTVGQVGPALSAVTDTGIYNIATATAAASSLASTVASAVASTTVVNKKRQTTGTSTTSTTSACPTTPEAGTYCGFINPEDPCAIQPDGKYKSVTAAIIHANLY